MCYNALTADMMKLVDMPDLESGGVIRAGSSPVRRTIKPFQKVLILIRTRIRTFLIHAPVRCPKMLSEEKSDAFLCVLR